MDISVLASVGSFVVSERVLKPKASVLVILGCVLAYDLTTKTHDVSSLRVYRGPGLLAFTLMMAAYSLRTWRRNGVACDELLFLPGTAHGEATEGTPSHTGSSPARKQPVRSEGDVAGGGWAGQQQQRNSMGSGQSGVDRGGEGLEPAVEMVVTNRGTKPRRSRSRTISNGDISVSSINEFANSWDEEEEKDGNRVVRSLDDYSQGDQCRDEESLMTPLNQDDESTVDSIRTRDEMCMISSEPNNRRSQPSTDQNPHTRAERFRENHPQITRIGSFFFFRSSVTSTHNAAYAPSGPMVMGAALDLCMPVLFNFHLFIEAWNHLDADGSDVPAKILPVIFLSVLIGRSMFPPGRRGRFWKTIRFVATTPFDRSCFRDLYTGDVMTSLVRPLQDVIFALAYYVTVIWGTVTSKYNLSDSGRILETSWLLHNVVLPSGALLPLWWKFLQTLRESYDTGRRWPYLGNAFKYLTAALVILYGMTHPENRRSPWWIAAFVASLVYQILWDTLIDWELFVIAPKDSESLDASETSLWYNTQISSLRPDSYWLLTLQRVCLPLRQALGNATRRIPHYKQIQIRPHRLYKTESFYWKIFFYNAIFRFCWMLAFIPAYHLSASGQEIITTFSSDTNSYIGVLLPMAEIFRRMLWGFLYLEMQTIKMSQGTHPAYQYDQLDHSEDDEMEISSDSSKPTTRFLPPWLGIQQQLQFDAATVSSPWKFADCFNLSEETKEFLFRAELSLWAVAFVVLGMWATT